MCDYYNFRRADLPGGASEDARIGSLGAASGWYSCCCWRSLGSWSESWRSGGAPSGVCGWKEASGVMGVMGAIPGVIGVMGVMGAGTPKGVLTECSGIECLSGSSGAVSRRKRVSPGQKTRGVNSGARRGSVREGQKDWGLTAA